MVSFYTSYIAHKRSAAISEQKGACLVLTLQKIIKDLLPKCADCFSKGHPNFKVLFMTDRFDLISSSSRVTYFTQLTMISS